VVALVDARLDGIIALPITRRGKTVGVVAGDFAIGQIFFEVLNLDSCLFGQLVVDYLRRMSGL
jgi:hypothetical protein